MNIDSLTIGELKQLIALLGDSVQKQSHSLKEGSKVLIRSVTHYYTGQIEAVTDTDIVLTKAAWIASTKRWTDTLKTGELDEVEPFPSSVTVMRAAMVDVSPWDHELPTEQK